MQTNFFDVQMCTTVVYLASYFLVRSDSKCTAHVCNLERTCWLWKWWWTPIQRLRLTGGIALDSDYDSFYIV